MEPLGCPFCGQLPNIVHDGFCWEVYCDFDDCRLCPSVSGHDRAELITAWNTRNGVPPASVPQDATEVRE